MLVKGASASQQNIARFLLIASSEAWTHGDLVGSLHYATRPFQVIGSLRSQIRCVKAADCN